MKKFQIACLIIGGMIVGSAIASYFVPTAQKTLGNVYEQVAKYFYEGFYVGHNNEFSISNAGVITSSAAINGGVVSLTGALTQGGGIRATSTSGAAVPLLSTDFDTESVIDVTLNVQDATLSFPASSTLSSIVPTAGQVRSIWVRNATTTAAMDITFSGGTGVLLKKATTTARLPGDTDGANFARIDLVRKANTDIEALLQLYTD